MNGETFNYIVHSETIWCSIYNDEEIEGLYEAFVRQQREKSFYFNLQYNFMYSLSVGDAVYFACLPAFLSNTQIEIISPRTRMIYGFIPL